MLAVCTVASNSCEWLTTYRSRQSQIECSVVDALSASMAIPNLFSSVFVGPEYAAIELGGGHLEFNNPARELLKEAERVYGDERRLSVIVSLGSGRPKASSLEDSNVQTNRIQALLKRLAANSEATERDLGHQLYDVGAYIRLNVDEGSESIQLHEWTRLRVIVARTQSYLTSPFINKLVDHSILGLVEKQGVMSLNQLSKLPILFFLSLYFLLGTHPSTHYEN
jgi:hypothetical protein